MGNRGCMHNKHQEIVRPYKLKAWIYCCLEYKDWWRPVMSPGKYTELFFLDEATALSAGHRPCGLCKYKRLQQFKHYWKKANDKGDWTLQQIDQYLHEERSQVEYPVVTINDGLPSGIILRYEGLIYRKDGNFLRPWSFAGYGPAWSSALTLEAELITPLSIVKAMAEGFEVQMPPKTNLPR